MKILSGEAGVCVYGTEEYNSISFDLKKEMLSRNLVFPRQLSARCFYFAAETVASGDGKATPKSKKDRLRKIC